MSLLLFIVGAVALMVGVAMAAYGIPINEFSFGNTMIVAGCSLAAGGLIVIGLGAVVAQLQRMGEILSVWTPGRSQVADVFEDRDGLHPMPSENRIPFPPRPQPAVPPPPMAEPDRSPAGSLAAAVTTMAAAPAAADLFAGVPSLRNPAMPAEDEKEEAPATPATPSWLTARDTAKEEPSVRLGRTTDFDSLWPEKRASAEPLATAPEPEPESEPAPETVEDLPVDERDTAQYEAHEAFDRQEPEEMAEAAGPADEPEAPPSEEAQTDAPQAAAVLKSGVVDGMAYTLYVDGSIEAELPQGTLRFSSINDLRNYLENNA